MSRLIDADALWNELEILCHQNKGWVNWNDALIEIKNAPTIEERKTGFRATVEKGEKGYSAGTLGAPSAVR